MCDESFAVLIQLEYLLIPIDIYNFIFAQTRMAVLGVLRIKLVVKVYLHQFSWTG